MRIPGLIIIAASTMLTACSGGWSEEYKRDYLHSCIQDAAQDPAMNDVQVRKYCDCSLEVLMKHYPTMEEVIVNKDSTAVRSALLACRREAGQ